MVTPNQLAKSGTEHGHQVAVFAYCAVAHRHGWEIGNLWAKNGSIAFKTSLYVAGSEPAVPALEWIHAIPNGGSRGDSQKSRAIHGGKMKAEGVRKGIPDIFLPWPSGNWHGLYIELKRPGLKPKNLKTSYGGLSKEQIKFSKYAKKLNYGFLTCYCWQTAVKNLKEYIEWK